MADIEAIENRIYELHVMRGLLVLNPEWMIPAEREIALDWMTTSIAEHQKDLKAAKQRLAA